MNTIKVDLHYHGPEEWLGTSRWNAWDIAEAASAKGLDALAITEMGGEDCRFDVLKDNSRKYEQEGVQFGEDFIYVQPFNLVLFRNQEIASGIYDRGRNVDPHGHVLLTGAGRTNIKDLDEVLDYAGKQKAAVILPHMYGSGHEALIGAGSCLSPDYLSELVVQQKIHAIEDSALMRSRGILNFLLRTNYHNERAVKFAIDQNTHIVANSDGHSMNEAGSACTRISNMKEKDKLLLPSNYINFITENLRNRIADVSRSWGQSPIFSADKHMIRVMGYILKERF